MQYSIKLICIVYITALLTTPIRGKQPSMKLSGFGDFRYTPYLRGEEQKVFNLGQVEIDLNTSIEKKIGIDIAIAYDPESETFGLGAFTVDLHLFGKDGSHFRRGGLDHSGIILGLFDVPFGIDWRVYPSIDRKLVSTPLVVENTHEAWNDYGAQAYLGKGILDLTLFAVNGFDYETADGQNEPGSDATVVEMQYSFGGRFAIKPFDATEIGFSYAGFLNNVNHLDMTMAGTDVQIGYRAFHFKSEAIIHTSGLDDDNRVTNGGFYLQGLFEYNRFFLVGRYNYFSAGENAGEERRFDAGVGWKILRGAELRVEHQLSKEEHSAIFIQIVVGFPQFEL